MIQCRAIASGLLLAIVLLLAAMLVPSRAAASPCEPLFYPSGCDQTVVSLDVRVWQSLDDPTTLEIRVRRTGDDRDVLPRTALRFEEVGYGEVTTHVVSHVSVAGVGLRVFQRAGLPHLIYLSQCASACPIEQNDLNGWIRWSPLGKISLSLGDGFSDDHAYRFGDMQVAVPRRNLALLRDREHLLALRDVFAPDPPLNWNVGIPTADWEGVSVAGTPPRVTGLELSNRGLHGELWGYIGDLTALRTLHLSYNNLTGNLPSKLHRLHHLSSVRLSGNHFQGCVPSTLYEVDRHDLPERKLPTCTYPPAQETHPYYGRATNPIGVGTYFYITFVYNYVYAVKSHVAIVFDMPKGLRLSMNGPWDPLVDLVPAPPNTPPEVPYPVWAPYEGTTFADRPIDDVSLAMPADVWLLMPADARDDLTKDILRTHYEGCIYDCRQQLSTASLLEKLVASFWIQPGLTRDGSDRWNWPQP